MVVKPFKPKQVKSNYCDRHHTRENEKLFLITVTEFIR